MDTSHAIVGQHAPLSSPSFDGEEDLCLSFDYKVWVSRLGLVNTPPPRLEVYIRESRHVYSGSQLWTSNGTGEGHQQISVRTQTGSPYWITFVGVVGHPDTTLITVANIQLSQDNCITFNYTDEDCGVTGRNYFISNCKSHETIAMFIHECHPLWCSKRIIPYELCQDNDD